MDLLGYLAVVRRRWFVIVLCLVAGLAGGLDLGHKGSKQYAATSQCLVNIPPARSLADQLAGSQLSSNLVQTYASLATSHAVAAEVVSSLHLSESPDSVQSSLSANAQENTYLINIRATADDPGVAQAVANAAAAGLSVTVGDLYKGKNKSDSVAVQVVNKATLPTVPFTPRPTLDLGLGVLFGLLAGLFITGLLEALDRTVKSTTQVDALLGIPLLGLVPRRRGPTLVLGADSAGPQGEPYRSLRTAVRFLDPDRPLRSILVTSPTPNDGKTTTVANLAVALSLSGERVIVVDADLRRAGLAQAFGLDRSAGLTSLVLGRASLDDVLQEWDKNLWFLASGPLPPNPSEILGSQLINSVLLELSQRADVVIIDAPPVLPVADALALATQVDGVMLVTRYGRTLRTSAVEASRRLQSVGANLVGYVLNAVPAGESRGYYAEYRYTRKTPWPTRPPRPFRPEGPSSSAEPSASRSSGPQPLG